MVFRNPLRSLKTRVTLVTSGVWLVSLWLLALVISAWQLQDLQVTLGTNQMSAVTTIAEQVTHQVADRIRSLEALASTISPAVWASPSRLQELLDTKPVVEVLFNAGAFFTGADGTAIASIPPSAGRRGINYFSRNHVRSALLEGKVAIGEIVVGAALGVPVFSIAIPVRDPKGQVIGSFVGVTDLTRDSFLDDITRHSLGKTGGYLLISRAQRLIVTATDKARIMEKLAPAGVNPKIDRYLDGGEGWQVLTNPLGVEVLVAAKQIPLTGWYVAAATPTAEAFELITNLQMRLLELVFVLTLLTGTLNWLLLKGQLTPVVSTIRTLTELTASDQPLHPLPVPRRDEIGDLIESFNSLLRTIEKREADRVRYETLIAQAQRLEALGVLAGGIAHDFNNLLAGVFGNVELALLVAKEGPATGPLRRTLGILGRARALTQQLITFSKGGDPELRTAPLLPFVEEATRFALTGSNVTCQFEETEGLPPCRYDRNQIGQVIDNLVINAKQAMPEGGHLTVSAAFDPERQQVRVSIADTGPGMPPDLLEKIFEPFFSTKAGGHGLGLTTCYSILQKHGGSMEVESKVGQGTTFHLWLPTASAEEAEELVALPPVHEGAGTLLLVDDEEEVLEVLALLAESFGYQTIRARNGDDALHHLREDRKGPRAIVGAILDLTIPGSMAGQEVLRHLRELDPELPALVTSGFAASPVLADPRRFGFAAALRKPFQRADLELALGLLFRGRSPRAMPPQKPSSPPSTNGL